MERIVAIVEGHLEYHFMTDSYPQVLVQRCIPNGDAVDLDLIVESIIDQLEVIDNGITKVVILLDREGRQTTSSEIANFLRTKLSYAVPHRKFYIGVADREAENWILADTKLITAKYGVSDYEYCGDGIAGKGRLKAIIGRDLAPRDKARLLKAVSPTSASTCSDSLSHFVAQVDFPWWWASS